MVQYLHIYFSWPHQLRYRTTAFILDHTDLIAFILICTALDIARDGLTLQDERLRDPCHLCM